jgi:hypothetical protein
MLIEEWDGKKLADPNANLSSSSFCTINFAQTNRQTSDTLVGGTTMSNPPA